ncbi:hypothetical protein GIB67_034803 [Kingdonia uniflora]|uniref:MsrB domain-containing protein n=1 Tax=Kingdonia uniflora TaxID=39325 RepID=A0A7J7MDY8_9MAGN|nr:hypothetical protein GIB67_034803 [Kingdonia uniflora]
MVLKLNSVNSLPTSYLSPSELNRFLLKSHLHHHHQFVFSSVLRKSLLLSPSLHAMGSSPSSSSAQKPDNTTQEAGKVDYASISNDEWKKRLTSEQFYITRKKGTERAFSGYGSVTHHRAIFLTRFLIFCFSTKTC